METETKIKLPNGQEEDIDLSLEDLDWDVVETDEREMGVERLYEAFLEKEVEGQDKPFEITLRVWEYPEGFVNEQEIELSEGVVAEKCDLGQFVISYCEDDDNYDYEGEDEP